MDRVTYRRYRIEGTLTTLSPLHVGSGNEREPGSERKLVVQNSDDEATIMEVLIDAEGCAFLPATTLKGRLHQWAEQAIKDPNLSLIVQELFGTGAKGCERGGRLIFQDARLKRDEQASLRLFTVRGTDSSQGEDHKIEGAGNKTTTPLYWKDSRFTYVMAGAVLNRETRTAERNKLYHYEVVPPGAVFQALICGEAMTDKEVALLLQILEQFNLPHGLALGGFSAHGFGTMEWKLEKVTGIRTEQELLQWLDGKSAGYAGFPEIPAKELSGIRSQVQLNAMEVNPILTVDLEIDFEGPFMINDPSQAREGDKDGEGSISHAYLKDAQGRILLTAKSLHGALRAQAERIVRTVVQHDSGKKACFINRHDKGCKPVTEESQVDGLCLTCRLFGGNGWRSPVSITDFTSIGKGNGEEYQQEFVAIDRFTGGASKGKKFNAYYCFAPSFTGQLKIELDRIDLHHAGLLVLTLRDLMEGDITLGFGRSKGFGACRARIVGINLPDPHGGQVPEWVKELYTLTEGDDLTDIVSPLANDARVMVLQTLVETFETCA
jgi:CRISPR/Cas system CSM-associated protein Csm3 (group 7 of RAMP superfamily)